MLGELFGFSLVLYVAYKAYSKHSLSYGGALTACGVGFLHIIAGWKYTVLLLFFFGTSSKLTKLWSNIKKQKEDNYHYGGERKSRQVIANSFIPTVICFYITLVRMNVIQIPEARFHFLESRLFIPYYFIDILLLPTTLAYYCECSADTWGSEVGIISSTPYLLLLPWKPVPAGTNGGISLLGLGAAGVAGLSLAVVYYWIQSGSPSLPFFDILFICMFSSIFGTFVDSFLGSILEESWWCASKKRILSDPSTAPKCCDIARKEKKQVSGHFPSTCGHVSGRKICSGNAINLLSSSVTSLIVFLYLLFYRF